MHNSRFSRSFLERESRLFDSTIRSYQFAEAMGMSAWVWQDKIEELAQAKIISPTDDLDELLAAATVPMSNLLAQAPYFGEA